MMIGDYYKHKTSGYAVQVIGKALLKADKTPVVTYYDVRADAAWVIPQAEFVADFDRIKLEKRA